MKSRPSLTLAAAIVITILFWGSAFAGIRAGLAGYSPAHVAALRFLAASLVLAVFAAARRMRLPARRDLPQILLLGLLGFSFYNLALNTGEQSVAAGPAALLIQTVPIWTALLANAVLHERLRPWGWVGIVVGFCGALTIALARGGGLELRWGAGLILAAAFSTSVYNIIQKHMMGRYRPAEITTYAIWAGTLLLLPFAWGLPAAVAQAPLSATLAVLYLGAAPAALAYVTWAIVLDRLPAARAASILYAVPVMAFLVGWFWLGEKPTAIDVVGGLLALSGVAIVNTLGRRPQRSNEQLRAEAPAEGRG